MPPWICLIASSKRYDGHALRVRRPGRSAECPASRRFLNHLLGRKLSITARKPQTTRHSLLGIDTRSETQIIFLDTPGIHRRDRRAMNRYMAGQAASAIRDSDVVVLLTEGAAMDAGGRVGFAAGGGCAQHVYLCDQQDRSPAGTGMPCCR